jgi:hypothetical protein
MRVVTPSLTRQILEQCKPHFKNQTPDQQAECCGKWKYDYHKNSSDLRRKIFNPLDADCNQRDDRTENYESIEDTQDLSRDTIREADIGKTG